MPQFLIIGDPENRGQVTSYLKSHGIAWFELSKSFEGFRLSDGLKELIFHLLTLLNSIPETLDGVIFCYNAQIDEDPVYLEDLQYLRIFLTESLSKNLFFISLSSNQSKSQSCEKVCLTLQINFSQERIQYLPQFDPNSSKNKTMIINQIKRKRLTNCIDLENWLKSCMFKEFFTKFSNNLTQFLNQNNQNLHPDISEKLNILNVEIVQFLEDQYRLDYEHIYSNLSQSSQKSQHFEGKRNSKLEFVISLRDKILKKQKNFKDPIKFRNYVESQIEEYLIEDMKIEEFTKYALYTFLREEYDLKINPENPPRCTLGRDILKKEIDNLVQKINCIIELENIAHEISNQNPKVLDDIINLTNGIPNSKNYRDSSLKTLLYSACQVGNFKVAELLVKDLTCDLEIKCGLDEESALFCSAKKQSKALVKLLLENGADPASENINGETSRFIISENMEDIWKLFSVSQKNPDIFDKIATWQYLKSNHQFEYFNTSDQGTIMNAIEKGKHEIKIEDEDDEVRNIDFIQFNMLHQKNGTTKQFLLRMKGQPLDEFFFIRGEKDLFKKSETLYWEFFMSGTPFMVPVDHLIPLNRAFFQDQSNYEFIYHFPNHLKFDCIDPEKDEKDRTSDSWTIVFDFLNFNWYIKNYDKTPEPIRWIPRKQFVISYLNSSNMQDQKIIEEYESEADDYDDACSVGSLVNENQTKCPEELVFKTEVLKNKGPFFDLLLKYTGSVNISREGKDLIVGGDEEHKQKINLQIQIFLDGTYNPQNKQKLVDESKTLKSNLDLNNIKQNLEEFSKRRSVQVEFPEENSIKLTGNPLQIEIFEAIIEYFSYIQEDAKIQTEEILKSRGDKCKDLDGLIFDNAPIRCTQQGSHLKLQGTESQIEQAIKTLRSIEDDVVEQLFKGSGYLIKDLKLESFDEKPVELKRQIDDLIVRGTKTQLKLVRMRIELKEQEAKEKEYVTEILSFEVPNKGYLVKALQNMSFYNQKIKASTTSNVNLKIEASRACYERIIEALPVLDDTYALEKKMTEVDSDIKELNKQLNKIYKINVPEESYFNTIVQNITSTLTKLQEEEKVGSQIVVRTPFVVFSFDKICMEAVVTSPNLANIKKVDDFINCLKIMLSNDFKSRITIRKSITTHSHIKQYLAIPLEKKYGDIWKAFQPMYKSNLEQLQNKILDHSSIQFFTILKQNIFFDGKPNQIKHESELKDKLAIIEKEFLTLEKASKSEIVRIFLKQMKDNLFEQKEQRENFIQENIKALDDLYINFSEEAAKIAENQNALADCFYRFNLLLKGFQINLPIFAHIDDFRKKLEGNRLVLVKAATGSGKSTLLPIMMLSFNYKRVLVTQPRRLPCSMISKRVNDTFDQHVSGWAVADGGQNKKNPLVYMTDGLLKEVLLNFQDVKPLPYDVIMLDEVHERGQNIDICIALLSLMIRDPKQKFRVILCSATLDETIRSKFTGVQSDIFDLTHKASQNPLIEDMKTNQFDAIGLTASLAQKLKCDQQILCFLPSGTDVNKACEIFNQKYARIAYPLLANQHPKIQAEYLKNGTVFFSTTIAETSLTFRNLVCVLDSGKIRMPYFDVQNNVQLLREVSAPESASIQRRGRLGRTQQRGEYYYINDKPSTQKYHLSELEKISLTDVYFSLLRKIPNKNKLQEVLNALPISQNGLNDFKQKLLTAQKDLIELGILDPTKKQITNEGNEMLELPIRGQVKMIRAVYEGLFKQKCGKDMLILAACSMIMGLTYTHVLANLPTRMRDTKDGDFMSILKTIHALLDARKKAQNILQFDIDQACYDIGIHLSIKKIIIKSMNKYLKLEKKFEKTRFNQISKMTGSWEQIAKSLLAGYYDCCYISGKEIGGETVYYYRLGAEEKTRVALLQSLLSRRPEEDKIPLIIARDIQFEMYTDRKMETGVARMAGRLEYNWILRTMIVFFDINSTEQIPNLKNKNVQINYLQHKEKLQIQGPGRDIIPLLISIDQELRLQNEKIDIGQKIKEIIQATDEVVSRKVYEENLIAINQSNGKIFDTFRFEWANLQVKIYYDASQSKFTIKNARKHQLQQIKAQIDKFLFWFKICNQKIVDERTKAPPKLLKKDYKEIISRVERVTNHEKSDFELMEYAIGPKANRTTRMELVAWVLINTFDCTLEGGFVRDWIVQGYSQPNGARLIPGYDGKLIVDENGVSPKDLDIHLSMSKVLDVNRLINYLLPFGIEVELDFKDCWRVYGIFDRNAKDPFGPFTADLILPFTFALHDMIDFDVNNLYVKSGYKREIGFRVGLDNVKTLEEGSASKSISIDEVIENIKKKEFQVMRSNRVAERVDKMIKRGWKKIGDYEPVLAQIGSTFQENQYPNDRIFKFAEMHISKITNGKIRKVSYLSNAYFDMIFEGQRELIKAENNGQENEMILYHGTNQIGADGITFGNFDNRFFKNGNWGYAFYFADDPNKSSSYTQPNANGERVIFLCKVLMGNIERMNCTASSKISPAKGYHSVIGTATGVNEYMVYRFGQAKPFIKIVYIV